MRPTLTPCATAILLALAAPAVAQSVSTASGEFEALNEMGIDPVGTIVLTPEGEELALRMSLEGLSPGMHLAHLHGFPTDDPRHAECPGPEADANGDGFIDLIETQDYAGVTMIPLTDAPASLQIMSESYPVAGEDGSLDYEQSVDLAELTRALADEFGTVPALDRRVVFIHGAPEGAELPDSVQSLEGVPAAVTLPVACAKLHATTDQ